jgi:hypothetical protein
MGIRDTLRTLFFPGQLVELRVLSKTRGACNLYYDNPDELAQVAEDFSRDKSYKGVYVTLHEIDRKILKEKRGIILNSIINLEKRVTKATENPDIKAFCWFLIDIDPERPSDASSTVTEKRAAMDVANKVIEYLASQRWPEPVLADSGNGWHVLYRIDLPCFKEQEGQIVGTGYSWLLHQCLQALSKMFTVPAAKVDTSVWKAAQITKLYGTMTRKGENTTERPWRKSKLKNIPSSIEVVSLEQLQALAELCPPEKAVSQPKGNMPELDEDFNIDDFCEHYNLVVTRTLEKGDRTYHVLDECPMAGHQHTGDRNKTALITGDTLGFKCWSDDCDGKTIGDLMRKLNEQYGRYDGPLFAQEEIDWTKWQIEDAGDSEPNDPEPDAVDVEVEASIADEDTFQSQQPIPPKELVKMLNSTGDTAPAPVKNPLSSMPDNCMYGWLGKKALELNMPLGYAYPAMLTVYSPLVVISNPDIKIRPNLYTALIGPVHAGKSVAIDRAQASLLIPDDMVEDSVPGSDRALAKMFGPGKEREELGPSEWGIAPTKLLIQDELRSTLNKVNIQGSCLAGTLQTLWYKDKAGSSDKQANHRVFVRLSILGGLMAGDEAEFAEAFGKETTTGLYDRFVYGVAPKGWVYDRLWSAHQENRPPKSVKKIHPECDRMISEWRDEGLLAGVNRGRLIEIAWRTAIITACANWEDEVTPECMRAAINFAEWQGALREKFKPSLASTDDQKASETILNAMRKYCEGGKWVSWRKLVNNRNWYVKIGASRLEQTKRNLVNSGQVVEESVPDELNEGKLRKTGKVTLAPE